MRYYFYSTLAVAVLFLILIFLISKRLRLKRTSGAAGFTDSIKEFRMYTFKTGILVLLIFSSMSYALTYYFFELAQNYFQTSLPSEALYANKISLYIPLAICFCGMMIPLVTYAMDKVLLKKRYESYLDYTKHLYGMKITNLSLIFASFNTVFGLFFLSYLGGHIALSEDKIYFQNTLSYTRHAYKYTDVKSITYIPSKRFNAQYFIANPRLILEFHDGQVFNSSNSLYDSWSVHKITKNIEFKTGVNPYVEYE